MTAILTAVASLLGTHAVLLAAIAAAVGSVQLPGTVGAVLHALSVVLGAVAGAKYGTGGAAPAAPLTSVA
jgi:hypothetical protein